MNDVTIKSTHNDPVVGLHAQIDQITSQASEYSTHDDNVISFHGAPVKKEDEEKLYVPVEQYSNYNNTDMREQEKELINLLLLGLFLLIVFVILTRNR